MFSCSVLYAPPLYDFFLLVANASSPNTYTYTNRYYHKACLVQNARIEPKKNPDKSSSSKKMPSFFFFPFFSINVFVCNCLLPPNEREKNDARRKKWLKRFFFSIASAHSRSFISDFSRLLAVNMCVYFDVGASIAIELHV